MTAEIGALLYEPMNDKGCGPLPELGERGSEWIPPQNLWKEPSLLVYRTVREDISVVVGPPTLWYFPIAALGQ